MIDIGAQLKWEDGKILYPSNPWKLPTKRRIPRLLIENRALEVGVYIYIEGSYVIFEESNIPTDKINLKDAQLLQIYQRRYQLIPARFKRQDTYLWMSKPGNALLLFGKELKWYILASKRP
ncbi:MAG: Uncharacterized protein G01um101493_5 [Microgenomates group bacterium Gr01-1014_93]|nr:MAG: Uncharacterized protein G01um101493_5 [Microgenomates group bacterium Gr01-1014_93]